MYLVLTRLNAGGREKRFLPPFASTLAGERKGS